MITRRCASLAVGIGLLVASRLSHGQPAATVRRVGYLSLGSKPATDHLQAALKQGMRDLGWVEGENVEYVSVYADSDMDRLDTLATDLVRQNVEVILAPSSPQTRAAQRATKTIPIVMANVGNPESSGFVANLARPGGNITGVANQADEVLGKLIGILHEVVPSARRIAVLLNENNLPHGLLWSAAQSTCGALDLVAIRVVASTPAQLGPAVEQIVRQRSQAVVVVSDAMYFGERVRLQELMQATRLPVAYGNREHVDAGGLLSYVSDIIANFRRSATYVDKILRGANPGDLPVEQPTKFNLLVNLRTAKALGITVPQTILLRADEVIQ